MRNKHSSNKNGEFLNNLHFELIFFYFVVSRLESSTIPAEVIMNEEKTCSSWVSTRMRDKLSAIDDLLVRELVNFDVNPSVYIKNCWYDFLKHSCGINRKHQFEKLRFEEVWGSGRKNITVWKLNSETDGFHEIWVVDHENLCVEVLKDLNEFKYNLKFEFDITAWRIKEEERFR